MGFKNLFNKREEPKRVQPIKKARRKCELIIEKTAKGIKKKIIGDCRPEEIEALKDGRNYMED